MKRRLLASSIIALLSSYSTAMFAETMDHSMHDMHNNSATQSETQPANGQSDMHKMSDHMDHSKMNTTQMDHSTMDHSKMDHDAMQSMPMSNMMNLPPAASFQLPTRQPLQALPLVKNQSQQQGLFKAELNPTPTEVKLSPKNATTMWLYNGEMLPIIDVTVGDKIDVSVKNNLPEPTTIHWHGLAVPPSQDGNPHDPIEPQENGQYQYEITQEMVGTHWFHPHTYGLTGKQVAQGLAGIFIVRDPNDPLKHLPEQNLFFSDLKLDENAQIAPNSILDTMNGREGQFALINGQLQPQITITGMQRLRLWNGNSARYLDLQFNHPDITVYLVGNDGGLIEKPVQITSLFLTPGERAELVIEVKQNAEFELISKAYDRDKMGPVPAEEDYVVAHIKAVMDDKKDTQQLPDTLRKIADFGTPTVKRKLVLTEEMMPMRFLINGKAHDMNRIDFTANRGEVEEWEITNNSHMDHNFHLHGDQFAVKEFEQAGQITQPEFKLLKDTINIKPGQTLRILTVQNQAGIRMYHCHILEHEDMGMMGQLEVK